MRISVKKWSFVEEIFKTPRWLVILLAFTIFMVEFFIMMTIHYLSPLKSLILALVDCFLLMLLIAPALYFWFFQPMIRYISDTKTAKDEYMIAEDRYRTLFMTLYEGSCTIEMIFDENGKAVDFRFIEVNPAMERQTGLQNIKGKRVLEIAPDFDPHWFEIFEKIALTGEPSKYEEEIEFLNRYYRVSAHRLCKTENRKLAVLLSDITDLKRNEADLIQAKLKAEESDRLKSSFLTTMSHELRTPLNSILGFCGILMQEKAGPLNDEQKKQLGMIKLSGRHLLTIINNILDLSKIEAGELNIEYSNFYLKDVIDEVMKIEMVAAKTKGIALSLVSVEDCREIYSDRVLIRQVLLNLVNNAVKFTTHGTVSLRCYQEGDFIKIEVTDTGVGIKEENLEKLFNPFVQVDNELLRKNKGTGTGLGLSIAKKLIELLHGSITVKSRYGTGSTFTISLPQHKT